MGETGCDIWGKRGATYGGNGVRHMGGNGGLSCFCLPGVRARGRRGERPSRCAEVRAGAVWEQEAPGAVWEQEAPLGAPRLPPPPWGA